MRALVESDEIPVPMMMETLSKNQVGNANEINEIKVLLYGVSRNMDSISSTVDALDERWAEVIDKVVEIRKHLTKKKKNEQSKSRGNRNRRRIS